MEIATNSDYLFFGQFMPIALLFIIILFFVYGMNVYYAYKLEECKCDLRTNYNHATKEKANKYLNKKYTVRLIVGFFGVIATFISLLFLIMYLRINVDPLNELIGFIKAGQIDQNNIKELERIEGMISAKGYFTNLITWTSILGQILLASVVLNDIFSNEARMKEYYELRDHINECWESHIKKEELK